MFIEYCDKLWQTLEGVYKFQFQCFLGEGLHGDSMIRCYVPANMSHIYQDCRQLNRVWYTQIIVYRYGRDVTCRNLSNEITN